MLVAEAWHSDLMVKASNQDGIYTADPGLHKGAKLLRADLLRGNWSRFWVEDIHPESTASWSPVAVERIAERRIKLIVVNGEQPENVLMAVDGMDVGTTVS